MESPTNTWVLEHDDGADGADGADDADEAAACDAGVVWVALEVRAWSLHSFARKE